MKRTLQILLMTACLSLAAQSYDFGIVSDYNGNGDPYEFTFVATPDFDNANPNMADIQITLAITAGNSIQTNSFTELFGTDWQVNTALTGSILQNNFGIGDGSMDIWVFSLPVPTSALTTAHNTGVGIPMLSFIVDNTPSSGMIEILENNDPIAIGLAGIGFVVDNVINADLSDGNGTQDYYGQTNPANNEFLFESLSVIDNEFSELELSLFPNPARDIVEVRSENNLLNKVEIYSISGQLIKAVETGFDNISIEDLEAAVYIVKIYGDETKNKTLRLVKH